MKKLFICLIIIALAMPCYAYYEQPYWGTQPDREQHSGRYKNETDMLEIMRENARRNEANRLEQQRRWEQEKRQQEIEEYHRRQLQIQQQILNEQRNKNQWNW
jgi:hypothetical protein